MHLEYVKEADLADFVTQLAINWRAVKIVVEDKPCASGEFRVQWQLPGSDETREVYESLKQIAFAAPVQHVLFNNWIVEACNGQINLFPPVDVGGCICLRPDGTWVGDIAPFAG